MRLLSRRWWQSPVILVSILILFVPFLGNGRERVQIRAAKDTPRKVHLTVGKSMLITLSGSLNAVKRISLAAPDLADAVIISTRQVYLLGKAAGVTNLTLWDKEDHVLAILDIEIFPDLSQIRAKLREIMPGEKIRVTASHDAITLFGEASNTTNLELAMRLAQAYSPKVINLLRVAGVQQDQPKLSPFLLDQLKAKLREILPDEKIRVTAANDAITLFGEVSSAARLSQAMSLAETYAPQNVVNLLQVRGAYQVMLEVRVAEMSRTLTRKFSANGLNLAYGALVGDGILRFALLNGLTAVASPVAGSFSYNRAGLTLAGIIDALKQKGLIKILAEPNLIAMSGQEASFLAGGEFPIPVPQGNDTLSIEFRKFGVELVFTPTVLGKDKIGLKVAPEVSTIDLSNAVSNAGFAVPGLRVRRVSTVIELAAGQSFAIAGLLDENVNELVSKFPILGDIPILGALFRSVEYRREETELIIIVTPHLVQPLELSQQPLPTDQFIEPNDFEFYLQGLIEGGAEGQVDSKRLDGEFGYLYGPLEEVQ